MVGTGAIVAQYLRGPGAHKCGAPVPDPFLHAIDILEQQLEMLGRDEVDRTAGLVEINAEHRPAIGERGTRRDRRGQVVELRCELTRHLLHQRRAGGHQDRHRTLIVLGLRDEVGRHERRIRGLIREHHQFRWARQHVDADTPREELLAQLTEIVSARTGYPEDMLDPDLDVEADLSIDSIKRLEILGELSDRIGLGAAADAGEVDSAGLEA